MRGFSQSDDEVSAARARELPLANHPAADAAGGLLVRRARGGPLSQPGDRR